MVAWNETENRIYITVVFPQDDSIGIKESRYSVSPDEGIDLSIIGLRLRPASFSMIELLESIKDKKE